MKILLENIQKQHDEIEEHSNQLKQWNQIQEHSSVSTDDGLCDIAPNIGISIVRLRWMLFKADETRRVLHAWSNKSGIRSTGVRR